MQVMTVMRVGRQGSTHLGDAFANLLPSERIATRIQSSTTIPSRDSLPRQSRFGLRPE